MSEYKVSRDVVRDQLNKAPETVRPIGIDEQWEIVESNYQEIANRQGPTDPLTAAWKVPMLDGEPLIERGAQLRRLADTPMGAMMFCFEMGFYPPPELAVTVSTAYYVYRQGCGHISLENALHGKPPQKAGIASKRKQMGMRNLRIRVAFATALKEGMSRTEAAEHAQEVVPDAPDADSIKRMLKGWPAQGKRNE